VSKDQIDSISQSKREARPMNSHSRKRPAVQMINKF